MKARPKAFLFDVFGTVVDWRSGVAFYAERIFAAKGIDFDSAQFADRWRGQYQPAMQRIRDGKRGYVVLDTLHRENLDLLLAETGLEDRFDDDERDELTQAWECLPPWPDSVEGLRKFRELGFIAPCSNGSIRLMIRLARFATLPWDTILGADIAGNYKPQPEVYRKSCSAIGLQPGEVMMIAAHNEDLAAARDVGLMTGFLPRATEHGPGQDADLEATGDWDVIGHSIGDLASRCG
ncbi:MAG: haloacid dehalogenase type II [Nitratireductor sp.]|nr:haloacid dehalogenase type II [Nitratireductor sp.]